MSILVSCNKIQLHTNSNQSIACILYEVIKRNCCFKVIHPFDSISHDLESIFVRVVSFTIVFHIVDRVPQDPRYAFLLLEYKCLQSRVANTETRNWPSVHGSDIKLLRGDNRQLSLYACDVSRGGRLLQRFDDFAGESQISTQLLTACVFV